MFVFEWKGYCNILSEGESYYYKERRVGGDCSDNISDLKDFWVVC